MGGRVPLCARDGVGHLFPPVGKPPCPCPSPFGFAKDVDFADGRPKGIWCAAWSRCTTLPDGLQMSGSEGSRLRQRIALECAEKLALTHNLDWQQLAWIPSCPRRRYTHRSGREFGSLAAALDSKAQQPSSGGRRSFALAAGKASPQTRPGSCFARATTGSRRNLARADHSGHVRLGVSLR